MPNAVMHYLSQDKRWRVTDAPEDWVDDGRLYPPTQTTDGYYDSEARALADYLHRVSPPAPGQFRQSADVAEWMRGLYPTGEVPVYFCKQYDVQSDKTFLLPQPVTKERMLSVRSLVAVGEPIIVPVEHLDGRGVFMGELESFDCSQCGALLIAATEADTAGGFWHDQCPECGIDVHRSFAGEKIGVYVDPVAKDSRAKLRS